MAGGRWAAGGALLALVLFALWHGSSHPLLAATPLPPPPAREAYSRTVCAAEGADGRFRPVYCDDGSAAAWSGHIRRDVEERRRRLSDWDGVSASCFVSTTLRAVFKPVLKAGTTTMKERITSAVCVNQTWDVAEERCGDAFFKTGCAAAERRYGGYLWFAFVRNPYTRWFSVYAMAVAMPSEALKDERKRRFIADRAGYTGYDPVSFEDFVEDPGRMAPWTATPPNHWHRQTQFVATKDGYPVVDFVGHVEHYERDFAYLFDLLQRPELHGDAFRPCGGQDPLVCHHLLKRKTDRGSAFGQAALKRARRNPFTARALALARATPESQLEFALLGYDAVRDAPQL